MIDDALTQRIQAALKEAGVQVIYGERLDLTKGVRREGGKITRILMESGREFAAKIFIDSSYEGDLMARAGVSYHVGREANATYGESINGVQAGHAVSHQFIRNVDPYVRPGDRSSGLLPGINPDGPGGDQDPARSVFALRAFATSSGSTVIQRRRRARRSDV